MISTVRKKFHEKGKSDVVNFLIGYRIFTFLCKGNGKLFRLTTYGMEELAQIQGRFNCQSRRENSL